MTRTDSLGAMSALLLADLPLAQYKNQIAASNVSDGDVLEEEGRIFFISALVANSSSQVAVTFINLNGEEQVFSPRYWTSNTLHLLTIPLCGRRFEFNRIFSYHGFYLPSGGSL